MLIAMSVSPSTLPPLIPAPQPIALTPTPPRPPPPGPSSTRCRGGDCTRTRPPVPTRPEGGKGGEIRRADRHADQHRQTRQRQSSGRRPADLPSFIPVPQRIALTHTLPRLDAAGRG